MTATVPDRRYRSAYLALVAVLVAGWMWQFAAYMLLLPKGEGWIERSDPRRLPQRIVELPWGVVGVALVTVALLFSIARRRSWPWGHHLLYWIAVVMLFLVFSVVSIVVSLSITGLTPAH